MANETTSVAEIAATVRQHGASWTAGETSLTSLPDEERRLRLGYVPGPGEPSLEQRESAARAAVAAAPSARAVMAAPGAWDWRNASGRSFVTPVKDQGGCGSCVAFGTTAAVEASVRVNLNQPNLAIDLSEAQLFYCVARQQGRTCANGWWPGPALDAYRNQGIADESCYPYVAGDQDCTNLCADWQSRVTRIAGWETLSSSDAMKQWIATIGPVASCFTVYNDFFAYQAGVYRHVTGAVAGGHCVCVVGYDDAAQCWICKNSWGPGWGDQGFFRIAYGECGIDATMWGVNVGGPSPSVIAVPLYRYWNPSGGDHFYTTSWSELGLGRYGWGFEGVQCYVAPSQEAGTVPLYRYWNRGIVDHFYTTSWSELGAGRYGWGYEGTQCYVYPGHVAGTVPLYRYWNSGIGDHFYTTSWSELGAGRYGWNYEGVQCYVRTQPAPYGLTQGVPDSFRTSGGGPAGEAVPPSFQPTGAAPGAAACGGSPGAMPGSFQTFGARAAPPAGAASFQTSEAAGGAQGGAGSFRSLHNQGRVVIQVTVGDG
jgi:C1A family cysteine protease